MELQQQKKEARIDLASLKRKQIHLVLFGHGNVGSELLNQLYASQTELLHRRNLDIRIIAVANSTHVLLQPNGIASTWEIEKLQNGTPYAVQDIIDFSKLHQLDNLIAVDNTADPDFIDSYENLVSNGFHLVSSNKYKNTAPWETYTNLRDLLEYHEKMYLYETNVGAGLPLIDTIKLLHQSGENITRIRGVFSGSLSFLFNEFSEKQITFSTLLKQAVAKGYTEPDPREDLCGMDVARKLLILARELELKVELDNIETQNLVPKELRSLNKPQFLRQIKELDTPFLIRKKNLRKDQVLRYVGDLHGDLSIESGAVLKVGLQEIPKNSMLGQLKGSDSVFEIYTQSYGANPIVIQGAGAGAAVTARGVFGDILRISNQLN